LLGGMLNFSDSMNRKVAGSFLYELLIRPLEHEVDEDGNQIAIGDNVRPWVGESSLRIG
jgi:condensin complex subunit 3